MLSVDQFVKRVRQLKSPRNECRMMPIERRVAYAWVLKDLDYEFWGRVPRWREYFIPIHEICGMINGKHRRMLSELDMDVEDFRNDLTEGLIVEKK